MKIIFIHGMNQQNYNAQQLKQHWLDIFKQGIENLNLLVDFDQLDISLPFYGDLMTKHKLSNNFDLATFLPKSVLNFHVHKQVIAPESMIKQFRFYQHLFKIKI